MDSEKEIDRYIREAAVAKLQSESIPIGQMAKLLGIDRGTVRTALERTTQGRYEYYGKPPGKMKKTEFNSRLDQMLDRGNVRPTLRSLANDKLLMIDVAFESGDSRKNDGFSPRTGGLISRLIDRANLVGLAWGAEIQPPSTNIPGFVQRNATDRDPIQFIPLCGIGENLEESLSRSSTVLAMQYHKLVNHGHDKLRKKTKLYNLNSLPIMHHVFSNTSILTDEARSNHEAIHQYIEEVHPDYTTIFGTKNARRRKPLIDSVDTVLTSVGASGDFLLSHLNRWFPNDPIVLSGDGLPKSIKKKDICLDVAIGDIAGILLPKPGANIEKNRLICKAINSNLATLRPEHLKSCRERTSIAHAKFQKQEEDLQNRKLIPPPAGVVAIVSGAEDIAPLLVALSEGYISRVIMDLQMEKTLKNRIKKNKDDLSLERLVA